MANLRKVTRRQARRYHLDPNIEERQIGAESGFRPHAVSPAGARGPAQLMPGTARELGVNPDDPVQNIAGGMKYMRQMLDRFHGNYRLALAAYNAGPGNVKAGLGYADKILAGQTPRGYGKARTSPALQRGGDAASSVGASGADPRRQLALSLLGLGFGGLGDSMSIDPLTLALQQATQKTRGGGSGGRPSYGGSAPATGGEHLLGRAGKVIGTPYQGTHGKAFNVRGGSDNWQSENADDIRVPVGTPVYAVEDGTLGNTGSLGEGGRFAGLRTNLVGRRNSYYYAHLSKLAPGIRAGARVRKGQLLGYTGEANGVPHLHFAVQRGSPGSYAR